MLQPLPMATSTWPIAGDAPDLLAIVQAQATVIHDNMQLAAAYQVVLDNAQAPPALLPTATGNGTAGASPNQTQLTVSAVAGGQIVANAVIAGVGIPTGTLALNQISGTPGGAGVYTTSVATTASSSALTFTPPPPAIPWPPSAMQDATDLNAIMQAGTSIIRTQTALLQQYQDYLNASETPAPPTGP